jgi:pseudolysin
MDRWIFNKVMETIMEKKLLLSSMLMGLPLLSSAVLAATPVNLSHQPVSILNSFMGASTFTTMKSGVSLQEISRSSDFNKTLHVRIQEMYNGVPVHGSDVVLHVANGDQDMPLQQLIASRSLRRASMNGNLYQNLQNDLGIEPTDAQEQMAIKKAMTDLAKGAKINHQTAQLKVYLDEQEKAHWAYQISFDVEPQQAGERPTRPTYIIDAKTAAIYVQWDDIQTINADKALGGGFGGNLKMGKLVYDGLGNNLPKLMMQPNNYVI